MFHCHHESGSAEAALRSTPISIGFLDRGQSAMFADAFDGGDFLPFATCRKHSAGEHWRAIYQHRACTATRILAAALRSGKVHVNAKRVEQKSIGLDRQLVQAAVDTEFEKLFFHANSRERKTLSYER
jgi:hypothetical protein